MDYVVPAFTPVEIDWAGTILIAHNAASADQIRASEIINNWRAAHYFPLNTFYKSMFTKAKALSPSSVPSQRIKRLASIRTKLERMPGLTLSQMQDIGGCRAVMPSVKLAKQVVELYRTGDLKHKLEWVNNYIDNPKGSGYRSIHLIYRYYSDKKQTYNGQRIEIQIRSTLQHAWATAVEIFGTILKQSLKSNQGEAKWLRFFALMGSAIAAKEGTPLVPRTPKKTTAFRTELRDLVQDLGVLSRLEALKEAGRVVPQLDPKGGYYFFLMVLNSITGKLEIFGYKQNQQAAMFAHLQRLEQQTEQNPEIDPVPVSVESISELQRAYPNYYLDTTQFLHEVREAIK